MTPDPRSLDFQALQTLRLVHELGSFSAAAERLDVNQSAVSYTLAKLRACFGDPLFVREGGRQVPTLRGERLLAEAGQMLDLLDAMAQADRFEPATSTHTLTIACNYYERVLLIPRIIAALRAEAPNVTIRVVNALGDGHHRLLAREADVLIGPFGRSGSGFHIRRFHTEEYACLMDQAHPMAGRVLSVQDYFALRHVLINYGGGWKSAYLQELEAAGHRLEPTLTVPSPAGLAELLAGSNLVATVPRRLGARIAGRMAMSDCPFRGRFDLCVVWTARTNASAMHRWLREIMLAHCA